MSSLCKGVVRFDAPVCLSQKRGDEIFERFSEPVGDLIRRCHLQEPLIVNGRGHMGVRTAAKAVHAIRAFQDERRVLTLL